MSDELIITNKTKRKTPSVPFFDIKNAVLGKNYTLSLVFIGSKASKKLNLTYRRINKSTNVLSFPISDQEGEIFIDLAKAKSEEKKFDTIFKLHVQNLFIHGLLHLKGLDHGSTMDSEEKRIINKFS